MSTEKTEKACDINTWILKPLLKVFWLKGKSIYGCYHLIKIYICMFYLENKYVCTCSFISIVVL